MKKPYDVEKDDGHTIVDMSQVPGAPGLRFGLPRKKERHEDPTVRRPWEEDGDITAKERLMAMLGALKATLLISGAYIVGLGAIILLMLLLWR